ncbi:reprolysin-like metallopeptidase [Pseudomonas sp. NPDC087626]|uniref:reprolysin-like metallopeptidase n=1 Tax=Pseudomonas sp. NPDC087626 TaxID=3364444 RepID=UPI00382C5A0C
MFYSLSSTHRNINLSYLINCISIATTTAPLTVFAQPFPAPSSTIVSFQQARLAPDTFRLDPSVLESIQQTAKDGTSRQLQLPLPEGGDTVFTLTDSNVLPPELAQRYPQIQSMKGTDLHGRHIRMDISDRGMRAIIFDPQGTWQIQPVPNLNRPSSSPDNYRSFRIPGLLASAPPHRTEPPRQGVPALTSPQPSQTSPINQHSREYRLAVATTSAYSQYFGGSVAASLASVVESINRVNAVFERDLGIHLRLVEDNDKLMFTDPTTDPYRSPTDDEDFDYSRKQNTRVLKELIGSENFDVGHLFEMSEGGGAINAAVCDDEGKAKASSGLTPKEDDVELLNQYFINTVTHELGHQFAADHTFNGCIRDADAAFEPGSGSTIMSYAGECFLSTQWPPTINPLHNLQNHKDTFFHAKNIEQVHAFTSAAGATCGVERINPNRPPVIATPYGDASLFIPARTPFALTGHAYSTVPNAQLTYTWEQIDLGPEQLENEALSDKIQGPIFRSYPPSLEGTRTFPKLEAILAEQRLNGEVYPATTRELNFRLTVRDNLPDLASTAYIDRKIHVMDTGQAFAVTKPTSNTTWQVGTAQSVSWLVAGTAQTPIACQTVRIELSLDGGHTYLTQPLLASTANTGQAQVTLPTLDEGSANSRIRLSCNSSVFFAVSPANFSIVQ